MNSLKAHGTYTKKMVVKGGASPELIARLAPFRFDDDTPSPTLPEFKLILVRQKPRISSKYPCERYVHILDEDSGSKSSESNSDFYIENKNTTATLQTNTNHSNVSPLLKGGVFLDQSMSSSDNDFFVINNEVCTKPPTLETSDDEDEDWTPKKQAPWHITE